MEAIPRSTALDARDRMAAGPPLPSPRARFGHISVRLTSAPGTYVLVFEAPDGGTIRVGALGTLELDGGWLLYVGSAFGPGGLRARLGRHLRGSKTVHWHVDYLVREVPVREIWWSEDGEKHEKAWASTLRAHPKARVPLQGFGSGDCGCPGHLIRFPERPGVDLLGGPHGPVPAVRTAPAPGGGSCR